MIKPYRQGDLDGLCGVYAVVNAVHLLCPEVDDELSDRLFRKLMKGIAKRRKRSHRVVWGGMGAKSLRHLAKIARCDLSKVLSIELTVQGLEVKGGKPGIPQIWSALQEALDDSTVAIVGLGGRRHHWRVAHQLSDKQMRLQDSNNLKVVLRSGCTTRATECRYVLSPENVLLLRRPV